MDANNEYTFASPRLQIFSFPYDMLLKIAKNPTCCPKGYLKLLKTCKWVFATSQIFPFSRIDLFKTKCTYGNYKKLRLFNGSYKIWITEKLNIQSIGEAQFTLFKFKLFRCDAEIEFFVIPSFDILKYFLTLPFVKHLFLDDKKIKHNDGTLVSVVEIMEILPKNCDFRYKCRDNKCYINYMNFENNTKNKTFVNWNIYGIPTGFNYQKIYDTVKKHSNRENIDLFISFDSSISDDYKNELQIFVLDLIEESKTLNLFPPMLDFHGFKSETKKQLENLRYAYRK